MRPMIHVHNSLTGKGETREMTEAEHAAHLEAQQNATAMPASESPPE